MAFQRIENPPLANGEKPEVSWGGIFSGVFLVLGLQFLFTVLGAAIGFSAFPGTDNSQGAAIGAGVYFFITMLISFYFGGYVAARLAGPKYRINSALHGVAVWAIVAALTAFTFGSSIKSLIGGSMNMAGQIAQENVIVDIGPQGQVRPQQPPKLAPEQKQELRRQVEQAAGTARKVAAGGSWYLFITFFMGLIVAGAGGSFGGSYFFRKASRS